MPPTSPTKLTKKQVLLVASGDLREGANRLCWPAQRDMERALKKAVEACGYELIRAHPVSSKAKHGFIRSQRQGMDVFASIDPAAKLIVAEAVWQYSHHVLAGLTTHRGPILTAANWSGQWPGLVGMLNLNGSLAKAGVPFSTLWGEDFAAETFRAKLKTWLRAGRLEHDQSHTTPLSRLRIPGQTQRVAASLAADLRHRKAILGVFDEGCMGMFNAIIPDHLLHPTGVFKERLSQSALYYATQQVPEEEGRAVYDWLCKAGMTFEYGSDPATELLEEQVLVQCRIYIAALRLADEFGCDAIGIQYQQGLKDLLPASDLAEGMLNNTRRPPVKSADGRRVLYKGHPLVHFNEADECAGLDGLLIQRVHQALGQPLENTLHDLRWADWDQSGTSDKYIWVFEISGAAPPAHYIGGWKGAVGKRQPPMYFPFGGSGLSGVSKPGEIVWSRIYVENEQLNLDIGRAEVVELPAAETQRRLDATTPQWPIMHAALYGVTRDQMMARHKANHVQVVYARGAADADQALLLRAAMADALGIHVNICGTKRDGAPWG